MNVLVIVGVLTMLQAAGQLSYAALAILQYFCVVDFMKIPLLVYIKILYFHNQSTCGSSINIGRLIEGVPDQALVSLPREPFTSTRTFILSCVSLALAVLWLLTGLILIRGAASNRKTAKWPWAMVTCCICGLDIVATVIFANDYFSTQTLSDFLDYIGGNVYGIGSVDLDTRWATWSMVILSSRFVALFLLNVALIIVALVNSDLKSTQDIEIIVHPSLTDSEDLNTTHVKDATKLHVTFAKDVGIKSPPSRPLIDQELDTSLSPCPAKDETRRVHVTLTNTDNPSIEASPTPLLQIPRPRIHRSLRKIKVKRLRKPDQSERYRIAEEKWHVREQVPAASAASGLLHQPGRRGTGTAADLQKQLPWTYIPSEAVGAVPISDYSANRKVSVYRADSTTVYPVRLTRHLNKGYYGRETDVLY